MKKKGVKNYSNFYNVEKNHNYLIPEEFPEGPIGSSFRKNEPVSGKSTPWKKGQQRDSAFVYPDKERHENLPRKAPGAHLLHDEKE